MLPRPVHEKRDAMRCPDRDEDQEDHEPEDDASGTHISPPGSDGAHHGAAQSGVEVKA
jgi:hypothetical protein